MVLAVEGSPVFFGGAFQAFGGIVEPLCQLLESFRSGGGVRQEAYGADWWDSMERFTNGWFENLLLPVWIRPCPTSGPSSKADVTMRTSDADRVAHSFKLAPAYPKSRFAGFEVFPAQAERARKNLDAAGLGEQVRVEVCDAAEGLPESYDVISTFDVIHDAVDPLGLLRGIRQSLKPSGVYVCLDTNCADRHEDNSGPIAAMLYGISVFYCMTTSLANGGAGLGTCGLPEEKARDLCMEAGFAELRRVPMDNPFNNLYEVRT